MNHEIMLYGIAQKEQLGFDKAVEECKYRMSRYGVTPNARPSRLNPTHRTLCSPLLACVRRCSSCLRRCYSTWRAPDP